MSEKTIWVAFDLEFRGDHKGLYLWLDKNGAKECCDYLAVLKFDSDKDILDEIEKDIKLHVKLNDTDRIYLVYKDEATGKCQGPVYQWRKKACALDGLFYYRSKS